MKIAVGEADEVAGEHEGEDGEDDPAELRRKLEEAAGDEGENAADEKEEEMAENFAAGLAVRLHDGGELDGGGGDVARGGLHVILARRTRLEMLARAVAEVISRSL